MDWLYKPVRLIPVDKIDFSKKIEASYKKEESNYPKIDLTKSQIRHANDQYFQACEYRELTK